jgi:hypothetical protein
MITAATPVRRDNQQSESAARSHTCRADKEANQDPGHRGQIESLSVVLEHGRRVRPCRNQALAALAVDDRRQNRGGGPLRLTAESQDRH